MKENFGHRVRHLPRLLLLLRRFVQCYCLGNRAMFACAVPAATHAVFMVILAALISSSFRRDQIDVWNQGVLSLLEDPRPCTSGVRDVQ